MEARFLALLILVPFVAVFAYATWHEYRRFKIEGRSTYGLGYDPETNSTYVGPIPDDEKSYDLNDFDADLLETAAKARRDGESEDDASGADQPDRDDKPQDTRS